MRCLCQASTLCNETIGCSRGYCGPYYLHREYWRDAGQVVLQDDDPDRDQAFVDCAADSACAQKVVENYMMKWGRVSSRGAVVRAKTRGVTTRTISTTRFAQASSGVQDDRVTYPCVFYPVSLYDSRVVTVFYGRA